MQNLLRMSQMSLSSYHYALFLHGLKHLDALFVGTLGAVLGSYTGKYIKKKVQRLPIHSWPRHMDDGLLTDLVVGKK